MKYKFIFKWDTRKKSRNLSVSDQNLSISFQSWYQAVKRKMNSSIQDALEIFYVKEKNQTFWLAERIMESKFKKQIFPRQQRRKSKRV